MTAPPPQSVIVLGAGLAGLATAYELASLGHSVTVLDDSGWGYAQNLAPSDDILLPLGCHEETWRLLGALLGDRPERERLAIPLTFWLAEGRTIDYRPWRMPGALQWLGGLLSFGGLTWRERRRLFSYLEELWEHSQSLPDDLDSRIADEWLETLGQSALARRHIWNPLAQWMTGNPAAQLSAAMFVQVMAKSFLRSAEGARLFYLPGSLESLMIEPLRRALAAAGGAVHAYREPPLLRVDRQRVIDIRFPDAPAFTAEQYVCALPDRRLLSLLPERLLTRFAYFAQMTELTGIPEIVIQVICRVTGLRPHLRLSGGQPFERLLTTPDTPTTTRFRLVAAGHVGLLGLDHDRLIDQAKSELRAAYPQLAPDSIQSIEVFRTDSSILALPPGAVQQRPIQASPISNLFLTGSWTDTGWPAGIEGTLVSARRCVEAMARRAI